MKSFITTLSLALLVSIIFSGCREEKERGKPSGPVSFGFLPVEIESNSRSAEDSTVGLSAVLVSISAADGELLYDKEELELYQFEGEYVSDVIQLDFGSYNIEEFFILDASGAIALATPKEGSDLAQLVDDPCPIHFEVDAADSVTYIKPGVLSVDNSTPAEFGYVAFGYQPVGTFDFYVSAFVYEGSSAFTLTDASLFLSTSNGDSLNYELSAGPNRIRTISGAAEYYLTFIKSGYPNQMDTLTEDELTVYSGTSYNVYFGSEDCKDELVELDGLIAYFQANGSLEDVSGTYSAEFYNGARFGLDVCDNSSKSFELTPDHDLVVMNDLAPKLDTLSTGAISFWYSPSEDQINKFGHIFGLSNTDGTGTLHSLYGIHNTDNRVSIHLWKNGYSNNRAWTIKSSTILQMGAWYHLVVTQDGTHVRLFVNGQEDWESIEPEFEYYPGAWISDIIGTVNTVLFGNYPRSDYPLGHPNNSLMGKFDNISFYNRALTADEIQTLYNAYGR